MISLFQRQSQQQRLSPQQVQYLKILQLPVIALEQAIKQELELNPLLEELNDQEQEGEIDLEQQTESDPVDDDRSAAEADESDEGTPDEKNRDDEFAWEDYINDDADGYKAPAFTGPDTEEQDEMPQRAEESPAENLLAQLRLQNLTADELALAEEIIGNIDDQGYLRRPLNEIIDDLNKFIATTSVGSAASSGATVLGDGRFDDYEDAIGDEPFGRDRLIRGADMPNVTTGIHADTSDHASADAHEEPRRTTSLSLTEMSRLSIDELARLLEQGTTALPSNGNLHDLTRTNGHSSPPPIVETFTVKEAEALLRRIQRLDPPGIGARNLQECLSVQLDILGEASEAHRLARRVIDRAYHEFTMKHFEKVCARLDCTTDELRNAIEVIRGLNPKPGEGSSSMIDGNYVIPDFVVERDGEEFVVIPNDRTIPPLRINRAYQDMLRRGRGSEKEVDRETRRFIRDKFEAAKWFIASIHQRRQTMARVMRAIVDLQIDFFRDGREMLRPMIYKDVADRIDMDISTVCRVVNGKYVQTDYGTFELRYFFSEALETVTGEEVSTKVVKVKIQEMIAAEDKNEPLSDDTISREMQRAGFNVARRTVAKYREQMNIPVARLRRAL